MSYDFYSYAAKKTSHPPPPPHPDCGPLGINCLGKNIHDAVFGQANAVQHTAVDSVLGQANAVQPVIPYIIAGGGILLLIYILLSEHVGSFAL